jgi:hypothetical protein
VRRVIWLGGDYRTKKEGLVFDVVEEHSAPVLKQNGCFRGNLLTLVNKYKTINAYEWDVIDIPSESPPVIL